LASLSADRESGHNSSASEYSEMEHLATSCSSIKLEAWFPSSHASLPPSNEPYTCHNVKHFIRNKTKHHSIINMDSCWIQSCYSCQSASA
jgi:hypothetical protein